MFDRQVKPESTGDAAHSFASRFFMARMVLTASKRGPNADGAVDRSVGGSRSFFYRVLDSQFSASIPNSANRSMVLSTFPDTSWALTARE